MGPSGTLLGTAAALLPLCPSSSAAPSAPPDVPRVSNSRAVGPKAAAELPQSKALVQIINGIAPISFETAMRLERVLGIPARFWNNLQSHWHEFRTAQAERATLAQHHDWLKAFPWKELVARGAVPQTNDLTERLASVLKFFAVHDVIAWQKLWDTQTGTLAVQFKKSGHGSNFGRSGRERQGASRR